MVKDDEGKTLEYAHRVREEGGAATDKVAKSGTEIIVTEVSA